MDIEDLNRIDYLASEIRYQAEMTLHGRNREGEQVIAEAGGPTLRPHAQTFLLAALAAADRYHAECARLAVSEEAE